jgi:DinB family protein
MPAILEVPMADLHSTLAANRDAVTELVATAEQCGPKWTAPRAPGKWSPSQVVEHVARSIDESANMISGAPSKFPTLPFFLRPVARTLLFNRVLRTGTFPKAKTNKAMDPASGPATPSDGRRRLEDALARFDRECRACAQADGTVSSGAFGRVSVADYARFIELHTRHHCRQMPMGTTMA